MIARTALDAAAIQDLDEVWKKLRNAGLDEATLKVMNPHWTLVQLVKDYSVIQLRGEADGVALRQTIDALDEESKALWEETLLALDEFARLPLGNEIRTTGEVLGEPTLPPTLRKELDLAVVSNSIAAQRNVPLDTGYTGCQDLPELSRAATMGDCETIRSFRDLARNEHYEEGMPRGTIWTQRFAPLARVATAVFVLDPFLFANFQGRDLGIEHVKWLLNRLSETLPEGVTVTILAKDWCSSAKKPLPERLKKSLAVWLAGSQFNKARPEMLRVYLAPWTSTELRELGEDGGPRKGGKPHDRHIRFNTWAALTTEEGFDRLKHSRISGEDGMTLHRVVTHPSADPSRATHIPNLEAKERAVVETSQWSWP